MSAAAVKSIYAGAARCRRKFLQMFPAGFRDEEYVAFERGYKWSAHQQWRTQLDRATMRALIDDGEHAEVAARAIRIESRTNLLFSFEKMALRDAVRVPAGARAFATGLDALLHGDGALSDRFDAWIAVVGGLPRRQTRVLTWPAATVFGFLAAPQTHFFYKPMVTRRAAAAYGYPLAYQSRPSWPAYREVLALCAAVKRDLRDLRPRDLIDLQSFLWIQGSDEYED